MNQRSWIARLLLWFFLSLLVGCSTLKLTYNFADWIVLWQIDRYFDLSMNQVSLLKGRLADLHVEHRNEALPLYAAFLVRIKTSWQDGLSREEVDAIFDSYKELRVDLAHRLSADGALFLAMVTQEQRRHLEVVMHEENQEFAEQLSDKPDERVARRTEAIVDWLEDWLGHPTAEQKHQISRLADTLPDRTGAWLAFLKFRQRQLLHLLRSQQDPAAIEPTIREWMAHPERGASPEYQQSAQQYRHAVKTLVLEVDQLLTPQQRTSALRKLQALIDELQDLAGRT